MPDTHLTARPDPPLVPPYPSFRPAACSALSLISACRFSRPVNPRQSLHNPAPPRTSAAPLRLPLVPPRPLPPLPAHLVPSRVLSRQYPHAVCPVPLLVPPRCLSLPACSSTPPTPACPAPPCSPLVPPRPYPSAAHLAPSLPAPPAIRT